MKQLSNTQLEFLLIEIEELNRLTLAIKEIGITPPSLFKLAHDKAERVYRTFAEEGEANATVEISMPATAGNEVDTPPIAVDPVEEKRMYDENDVAPLAHPSLSEKRYDPIEEEKATIEHSPLYTQPFLIETPTTPNDNAILNDRIASIATSLSEALERKNASDLRKAFSLNDRFRFQRELFRNNPSVMEETLVKINAMLSFDEAYHYLTQQLHLDPEKEEVSEFILIVEKRFS